MRVVVLDQPIDGEAPEARREFQALGDDTLVVCERFELIERFA